MNRLTQFGLGFAALTVLSLSATSASAAITGVAGATTWLGSPPASCMPGTLTGFTAYTWDEQTNIPLSITADMVNNPGFSSSATAGPLSGVFDSHFIHFEGAAGAIGAQGQVTFSSQIVGVMFINTGLDSTDVSSGSFGTVYPTGNPTRGLNNPQSFVQLLGNVLRFDFKSFSPAGDLEQVRVYTKAPAPGAVAGLGLAGAFGMTRRRRSAAV